MGGRKKSRSVMLVSSLDDLLDDCLDCDSDRRPISTLTTDKAHYWRETSVKADGASDLVQRVSQACPKMGLSQDDTHGSRASVCVPYSIARKYKFCRVELDEHCTISGEQLVRDKSPKPNTQHNQALSLRRWSGFSVRVENAPMRIWLAGRSENAAHWYMLGRFGKFGKAGQRASVRLGDFLLGDFSLEYDVSARRSRMVVMVR